MYNEVRKLGFPEPAKFEGVLGDKPRFPNQKSVVAIPATTWEGKFTAPWVVVATPTVSYPYSPPSLAASPKFCSACNSNAFLSIHVVDEELSKRPPLQSEQFEGVFNPHPASKTTHVSDTKVDSRTRTSCAGFPTRIVNEDQLPSLPSL